MNKFKVSMVLISLVLLVGCGGKSPVMPENDETGDNTLRMNIRELDGHNKKLWSFGLIMVNDDHTQFDYVPVRSADFHFNALKFLEDAPCKNCVTVKKIEPKGDGIVEIDVGIQHPFPGLLMYTGFDVKGIIMFNGSLAYSASNWGMVKETYPDFIFRFNLACAGDWELLNEDGFTIWWSPEFMSGSDAPIFNYMKGKFSTGLPNSTVNAYKAYWTHEERRMFLPGYEVTRTYRIQTQPGPMIVGYAVEACWEPPLVTPVTDPAVDFPISANQGEPYIERYYLEDEITLITAPHTEKHDYLFWCQFRDWPEYDSSYWETKVYWSPSPCTLIGGKWKMNNTAFNGKIIPLSLIHI